MHRNHSCSLRLSRLSWLPLLACSLLPSFASSQSLVVRNAAGIEMTVDASGHDPAPALSVVVPDGPPDDRRFKILLPEHLTALPHGHSDVEHLYIYDHAPASKAPDWKKVGNDLEYSKDYGTIHFSARATLLDDGILFHYAFSNSGTENYDMITAVTDPRFHAVFYDPRLERTYVHHNGSFELLAAHTPERLRLPLQEWFPVRYLASYTAPIPTDLVQKRADGITYRYSPDRVDEPVIATLSKDGAWVAASFSKNPGNVWTNPQLTCQHVDPQVPLPKGGHAEYEMKILLFKGTLQDALEKVKAQVSMLK